MKKLFLILGTSLFMVMFLSACAEKEIIIKKEINHVHTPIPKVQQKPEFIPYQAAVVEIDNKKYYLIDMDSGLIMIDNYQRFKLWSMRNYILLLDLRKDYLKKSKKQKD